MKSKMKSWQEWLLFSSVMILVFMLGIGISSLLESRKEIATITYTQKAIPANTRRGQIR